MDRRALQTAYEEANRRLREALLNGTHWEDVQEYRFQVTTLDIALHRQRRQGGDPSSA